MWDCEKKVAGCYNKDMSLKSLVEKVPGYNSLVKPWHYLEAVKAARQYKMPAQNLRVIAVTGTNGKTTTCFMIWRMLIEAGHKAGLLTTVGWSENGQDLHRQYEHMTTERVEILNQRMRAVADAGAEFLVLEVTSHALSQSRIWGVPIEIAVFTNLTHEHLDYHKTFENYRNAKLKLFKQARYGVVNMDDPNAKFFVNEFASGDVKTYGIERGDLRATGIELERDGVEYACGDMKIRTRIPGKFNVYNSLATVGVGKRLGLSDQQIERGIYALEAVEGRMNRIDEGQGFDVIVDYAHTPDALENVYNSLQDSFSGQDSLSSTPTSSDSPVRSRGMSNTAPLRASNLPSSSSKLTSSQEEDSLSPRSTSSEIALSKEDKEQEKQDGQRSKNSPYTSSQITSFKEDTIGYSDHEGGADSVQNVRKIISVHGGAGRRDETTRAERGEILGKYSDIVIITEDDSRDEDPAKIAAMFVEGAEKAGKVMDQDLFVDLDRRSAIKRALEMARPGDLVLVLGKGHEKTILRSDGAHEFEDVKVVRELLASLNKH